MTINPKRRTLVTILLMALLLSFAYATLTPLVSATEVTAEEKTMNVLDDVVGISTETYAPYLSSQTDSSYLSLPQKEADITLASEHGTVRARCCFVNNILREIYLSDYGGELAAKQPAVDTPNMARGFLESYQNFAGDSLYGEFASMLDNIDAKTNTTKYSGNIKLDVMNSNGNIIDYVWTFADANGIIAHSKNVLLSYDQGQLKLFLNNWPFYRVVGTPKISSEEATAIALEASETFSYEIETGNVTSAITGFKIAPESLGYATLSYLNFPNQSLARGGDPFTLFPSWYVPLRFDKTYPGDVTGMTVSIWADTGEISIMGPIVFGLSSSNDATEQEKAAVYNQAIIENGFTEKYSLSMEVTALTVVTVIGIAAISAKKISYAHSSRIAKKFHVTLLCGLVLFSIALIAVPTTSADIWPNSKSRIYGALDGGGPTESPAQLPDEKDAAYWLSGELADAFIDDGYNTNNQVGAATTQSSVYANAENDEGNYDRVAIFHFGHMCGFGQGFVDNSGYPILSNSSGVDSIIDTNKYFFVFIWACAQARYPHNETCAAWMGRSDLSGNGFTSPDTSGQAYIGFDNGSPIISDYYQQFAQQSVEPLQYFIDRFYDYALGDGYSVNAALDQATADYFQDSFTLSILILASIRISTATTAIGQVT